MDYRREIDGLRAVAVIPVILFHAGFQTFSGGYVGVDVFFVISGYLITSIIITEMEKGTFSLAHFYERRARRILPALFLVMLVCLPLAWLWLVPNDMKEFSKSLRYVSGFISNFLFYKQSGYFDTAAELKPLLHTWSLAVEEQYYVFFPLLLMITWRLGIRWTVGILGLVAIVSLGYAHRDSFHNPAAGFYLLPTRFWELLIGALVAFYFFTRNNSRTTATHASSIMSQSFGLAGLLLIVYAVFEFDRTTPFPGLYALVPTLGTALIIVFANEKNLVGRFLANRALVGIGLISYSAYLWHQPLFAFARHRSLGDPGTPLIAALSLTAIALAYLSWRYVEIPFRNRNSWKSVLFCREPLPPGNRSRHNSRNGCRNPHSRWRVWAKPCSRWNKSAINSSASRSSCDRKPISCVPKQKSVGVW